MTGSMMEMSCQVLNENWSLLSYASGAKVFYYAYMSLIIYLSYGTLKGGVSWYVPEGEISNENPCALYFPYYELVFINVMFVWAHEFFKAVLAFAVAGTTATWYFHRNEVDPTGTGGFLLP